MKNSKSEKAVKDNKSEKAVKDNKSEKAVKDSKSEKAVKDNKSEKAVKDNKSEKAVKDVKKAQKNQKQGREESKPAKCASKKTDTSQELSGGSRSPKKSRKCVWRDEWQ